MRKSIRSFGQMEALMGPDPLTEALRGKIREMILALTQAELREVLAAQPYECSAERQGYRHGRKLRSITTGLGAAVIELPRARLIEDGQVREWQSALPRSPRARSRALSHVSRRCFLPGASAPRKLLP